MNLDMENEELREILEEFFTEAEESLDQLEQDLIKLETYAEENTSDPETVNRIFRVLHTLKGGAGFLGLDKMAKVAHAGENLLDEVRTDKVTITKPVMDALLQTTDALKSLLLMSKARQDDSGVDNSALVATLESLAHGGAPVAAAAPAKAKAAAQAPALAKPSPAVPLVNADLLSEVLADDTLHPDLDKETDPAPAMPLVDASLLSEVLGDDTLHPSRDKEPDEPLPVACALEPEAHQPEQRVKDDRRQQPRRNNDEGGETIRVEIARLDKVMNLVGELVLARNTLLRQMGAPATKAALEALKNADQLYTTLEQFSRVTQDIQMSVLSTRMQPIKKVFDKIPRQVRELKMKLAKEVNLVIEGEMTEVDKSLVEELSDPMLHMVRNALDHGLETPEERFAAGKNPEGTLTIRAFYEGNNVVIQVREDGKGIDPAVIRKVAVKKGIITQEAADALSDHAAIRLIMAPGFSTAAAITDVSGRGVGMDVVNTNIAKMQGTLDIKSVLGAGTCFSIYLPLTLAIVNALVVEVGGEGFAVPIGDIAEVIKFEPETRHRINETDVVDLRGDPLQLFYLATLTRNGFTPSRLVSRKHKELLPENNLSLDDLEHAVDLALPAEVKRGLNGGGFVLVVREANNTLGVVVDKLLGQEEVVVKSVGSMFGHHEAVSGATISGDGKVHMILDVPFLMKNLANRAAA